MGRDYADNEDGYVYIYSTEGAYSNRLLLASVKKSDLSKKTAWEFFRRFTADGMPEWTKELTKRGPVHIFPDREAKEILSDSPRGCHTSSGTRAFGSS